MYDRILIRYGELSLKKSNRNQFTNQMKANIKRALKNYDKLTYLDCSLRFYIILNGEDVDNIIPILQKIPGIYSFSLVARCESNIDDISKLAYELLSEELKNNDKSFKVETNRGDKSFPLSSIEISKKVASYLFKNIPNLKADVHNPDITLSIDLRNEGSFIYTNNIMGLGGLPAGCLGNTTLMISGGIDSVVAGYLTIRKGMNIDAMHFASPPYTSKMAVQKVIDLLEVITPYSKYQEITLMVVPFTKLQKAIYDNVREDYCITIMRRMMYKIAEKVSKARSSLAIINGENVGQVASQTLESINVIENNISLPIIRPLATYDKSEIIDLALKINTYDISIRPYEDCCTVFVPKHPQIKPRLDMVLKEENKIDFEVLIEEAIKNIQYIKIKTNAHYDVFKIDEELF